VPTLCKEAKAQRVGHPERCLFITPWVLTAVVSSGCAHVARKDLRRIQCANRPELADHPSTIEDFTYDLTQNPKHMYNTNKDYPGLVEDLYRDLLRHLKDCNITLPKPKGD